MSLSVRLAEGLLRWLSRRSPATRLRLGRWLGDLAWHVVPSRRRIALRNLELCFPSRSAVSRQRLARRHFRALAQSMIDRSVLWYGTPQAVQELVTLEGGDILQAALARGPVVLLAPHFVGLDAGATRLSMEGRAASMYQVQGSPAFDALFRKGRSRFNEIALVSRREGLRTLLRHLRDGLPLYYLPDMDFGRRGAAFVPFFGVPAATLTVPAQLARTWDVQILPVVTYWQPHSGRYCTQVHPPLENFPGTDEIDAATARLNRDIEGWIRPHPSQYHWVHKRFKTRPVGDADLYKPAPPAE